MSIDNDQMIESVLASLNVGCPIFTADGEQIGTLAEVRNRHLKVNAPMRRDYWIDASSALISDGQRIELTFNNDDLGAYKLQAGTSGVSRLPDGLVPAVPPGGDTMPTPEPDRSDGRQTAPRALDGDTDAERTPDRVVSEREQLETRMRMEGGLVDQRRELRHASQIGEGVASGTVGETVESELARLEQEHPAVGRQTFGVPPPVSPPRFHPWLFLAGMAVLAGAVGAGLLLRRRMHASRKARIIDTAQALPRSAEAGVKAVRDALDDARTAIRAHHIV